MPWKDPETGEEFSVYPTDELSADLQKHHSEECHHEVQELRLATNAAGIKHLRMQCLGCGALIGNALPKKAARAGIPDADPELEDGYKTNRQMQLASIYRKHHALQLRQRTDFKGQHAEYLKSAAWQKIRGKVLERASGICEGCRERPAKEIHHLTYEHWQNEFLFELVALCSLCHVRCHDDFEVVE